MANLIDRVKNAWNVFSHPENANTVNYMDLGSSYSIRPDRTTLRPSTERSIISSIYTRIAIDVASITIQHVKTDSNGRFLEVVNDSLNRCLTQSANLDQTGRAMIQDAALSLCDEGCIAIVPVSTDTDLMAADSFGIIELRVGKIVQWYPTKVKVSVYNELSGYNQEIILSKDKVAIVENPLYPIMNEPNSTLRRLIHKLNILDAIDEQSGAGKLDIIIQLPYTIKSEQRKAQADMRRKEIEMQLTGSKYGIAYIDGTERVTQLNRPAENNLMNQITYLTNMLYSQTGLSEAVFNGTASESEMLNYHNRTIEPIVSAIVEEMDRKFLTQTARTQKHKIMFFKDPFKLVPVTQLADIADKFTRNEILSSNEVRAIIGYKPVDDPRADELRNKNLNKSDEEIDSPITTKDVDKNE